MNSEKKFFEYKEEICPIGRLMYSKGLSPGTSGNISVKCDESILITPSGFCLGEMSTDDIVIVDIEGNVNNGIHKPSSELPMHISIYQARTDLASIIHAHPAKSTAFAVAGIPLNKYILSEAVVTIGEIPIAEYATPSSNELASIAAKYYSEADVILLANHGVVTGGKNLKETFYKLESLESCAEIIILAKILGKINDIPDEKVEELLEIRKKQNV